MSYPKKSNPSKSNAQSSTANPKLSEARKEKLLAIQQREQLKGLLVNKFVEKYGKNKEVSEGLINKEVTDFMKNEKLTEENLRKFEQRIKDGKIGQNNQAPSAKGGAPSVQGNQDAKQGNQAEQSIRQIDLASVKGANVRNEQANDDAISVTSSQRPRSVYQLGEEDDEWATMMKYDAELHKKERELEKLRDLEQKKKIKDELDRQLEEKRKNQEYDRHDLNNYRQLMGVQMDQFDNREQKKETDMKAKIMAEKYSRDKQLQEENQRKKYEKKVEKEMDAILVKKVQQEIDAEIRMAADKRKEQKEQLRKVLLENEERRRLDQEFAAKQKADDIKAQKEYTRLIEAQEAARAAEIQAREDRAKQFMSLMADTIVKDQREQLLDEERKTLQHYLDRESREIADEKVRQKRLYDQKRDIKAFLDKQLEEKEKRRLQEKEIENLQARIWKKDTEDYNYSEKAKFDKMKEINLQQQEFLKKQIDEERKRKGKKMSTEELLLNKPKLKEIAERESATFQKSLVSTKQ